MPKHRVQLLELRTAICLDTPFLLRILLFCLIGSLQQLALIRGAARGQRDSITGAGGFNRKESLQIQEKPA